MRTLLMATAILLIGAFAQPQSARAESNVLFIFDASGSMKVIAGGQSRIDVAKRAMSQALKDMPSSARLGLLMYGHRRAKDCSDIELVSPIGADGATTIDKTIQSVQPRGETPIAEALTQAARNFAALKGQTNRIVLITDGIEECGGDPCQAARAIKAAGLDLKVHVVGFALTDAKRKAVQCIAEETGGKMLDARDSGGLSKALGEVRQEVTQAPPPPPAQPLAKPGNLLLAENGGHVVSAPSEAWGALSTVTEEPPKGDRVLVYTHAIPSEVVFGFKDGQAATFDRFTVYIPRTYARNLKQFELLAADEAFGEFRSLGRFEAKNIRLLRQPYQEFAVPETTAHFVKLRVLSSHGDTPLYLNGLQLFGKLDGKPVPAPAYGPKPGQVNVLAKAQGGVLVASPFAQWEGVISQPEDYTKTDSIGYTHSLPSEAIFGFKDGRSTTFDKVAVLVPQSHARNVSAFEVLAADDPGAEFRSLGQFTTRNTRIFASPYQEFDLPETTARYVKLRLIKSHGDSPLYLYPFKLFGKHAGEAQAAVKPGPGPGQTDILSKANGGSLVAAPFAEWEKVIAQPDDYTGTDSVAYTHGLPSEAIFAFKGGAAATFDKFALLVPQSYGRNARQFEILANDDLGGEFRSLGKFQTQNIRFKATPYQEFALPETTAKYVKVRILNTHGDTPLYLYPMKLFGKLAEGGGAAPAVMPGPGPGQTNILSKANGGMLLAAPFAEWEKVIAQPDDYTGTDSVAYTHGLPSEAIFAFKGEAPATFDKFAVLVPKSYGRNARQFEILASDDIGGEFRSLGKFQTQNIRFKTTPYQEFALPETTAKYVKVRILNTHGDTPLYLYPMKLFGRIAEGGARTASTQPVAPATPGDADLIGAGNGGMLLVAPDSAWEKLTTRDPDNTAPQTGELYTHRVPMDLIYAFRDEKEAEISVVRMLVPATHKRNIRRFEVLVADDISAEYRSIGVFETQNLRMVRTPYQEFALPKTRTRYVKLRIIDSHGDMPLYVYGVQVVGRLLE